MEINVQFNPIQLRRIQQQLVSTGKATGMTVQWLCWDQMRLACLDAVKYSPPWGGGKPGTGKAQRDVGKGAVEKDLDRLFARDDNPDVVLFKNKRTGKMMGRNKKTGRVFSIDDDRWMPKDIAAVHRKARNKRGRIGRQNRQVWVKAGDYAKHLKSVQSRVGSLKASWLPALRYFGGRVGGKRTVPAWISKQNRQEGVFSDRMTANGNGMLVSTSTAHHANAIRPSLKKWLETNRQRQMQKYGERRMQQIADQFNANRTSVTPIRQNAAA